MKVLKIAMPIAMSLVFLGCASKNYEEAVKKDTVYAYKNFLKEYGDSDYAYKAKRNLHTLQAYNSAKNKNSISGYNYFLSNYASSKYSYQAKRKRDYLQEKKYVNNLKSKIRNANSGIEQAVIMNNYAYVKAYNDAIKNDYFLKKYYNIERNCFKTKKDIVVIDKNYKSVGFSWLSVDTTHIYAGKIFKGDIVYKDGYHIRTLHNVKDLTSFTTNENKWLDNIKGQEAFGSYSEFKQENKLSDKDLFSSSFSSSRIEKFVPTRYSTKTSGLGGSIGDFISDHPIASIAIGAVAYTALSPSSSSSSSSTSYSSSNSSDSSSSSYDISEDSSMTKWKQKYCSACGKSTRHKIFRHSKGSPNADYQCKTCSKSSSGKW